MRISRIRSLSMAVGIAAAIAFISSASAWVEPSKSRVAGVAPVTVTTTHVTPTGNQVQTLVASRANNYVEDEVLIKYKPLLKAAARADMASRLGVRELRHHASLRVVHARLPPGQSVAQAVQDFMRDPSVEQVQPNFIYQPLTAPNDPLYGQQWGLKNTGQTITGGTWPVNNPGVYGSDMGMEQAWDQITDCSAVVVAVIDSGVNYLHQELAGNMWDGSAAGYPNHGYDFVGDNPATAIEDNDPLPSDANGHGTHVAATIAAAGNNGIAGSGVCWKARIMAVRSLSESGGTTATVVAGMNFAVTQGARVINMSLGGSSFDQTFSDAITAARNAGVVVVVAAGNDGRNNDGTDVNGIPTPTYPCNFTQDNLLCVAALDQAYNLASFSNFGTTSVDVGAPGTNVLSAWPGRHIEENFSAWTKAGGWAGVNCEPISGWGVRPMLVNPANWCSNGTYANNAADVTYRTYDFTTAVLMHAEYYAQINLEQNVDFLDVALKSTGGNPFGAGGLNLLSYSNSNRLLLHRVTDSTCTTATCSIGFRLRSNATNVLRGAGVFQFTLDTVDANSSSTFIASGTSMATPHTAGVAAMLLAFNPGFTYSDAIEAIKSGGRSVAALANTVTGRAVDAYGALRHIKAPTGVTARVQ